MFQANMSLYDCFSTVFVCWFDGCLFRTLALKSQFALSYRFKFSTGVIMYSWLSRIASNHRCVPLVMVCGALSITVIDLLKS